MFEKLFKLKKNHTTVRTEILAGVTTFMTMAYILFLNPNILSATGMDKNAVFFATAIAAGVVTIAMGLYANFPIALAPGMGLNAFFATIALQGVIALQAQHKTDEQTRHRNDGQRIIAQKENLVTHQAKALERRAHHHQHTDEKARSMAQMTELFAHRKSAVGDKV